MNIEKNNNMYFSPIKMNNTSHQHAYANQVWFEWKLQFRFDTEFENSTSGITWIFVFLLNVQFREFALQGKIYGN